MRLSHKQTGFNRRMGIEHGNGVLSSALGAGRRAAQHAVSTVTESARRGADAAVQASARPRRTLERQITQKPWRSVRTAFGAGAVGPGREQTIVV